MGKEKKVKGSRKYNSHLSLISVPQIIPVLLNQRSNNSEKLNQEFNQDVHHTTCQSIDVLSSIILSLPLYLSVWLSACNNNEMSKAPTLRIKALNKRNKTYIMYINAGP